MNTIAFVPGSRELLVRPCVEGEVAPGLLLRLRDELDLDPAETWMIGDTAADVQAALREANGRPVSVRAGGHSVGGFCVVLARTNVDAPKQKPWGTALDLSYLGQSASPTGAFALSWNGRTGSPDQNTSACGFCASAIRRLSTPVLLVSSVS